MKYKYNKNRLPTREKDIVEAIDIAAPTNNKGNEDDIVPVELVDQEERIQDGYGDGESVTIRFQMKYKYNKNRLLTIEKDVVEAIDTTTPTNNEQNEDLNVAIKLVDKVGKGDRYKRVVITQYQYISITVLLQ